jgi:hypothetical protein
LVVLGGLSLYLFVFGFSCGAACDRIQACRERTAAFQRYDEAVQQWYSFLMASERRAEIHAVDGVPDREVR